VANSIYLYSAQFLDYLLVLIVLPFTARMLGPEELGRIGLAGTFGIFILLIMEFGFPLMATREIAKGKNNPAKVKLFLGQLFSFKLFLIPIILILSFIATLVVPIFRYNPHYILIVVLGAIAEGLAPYWYFQGIEKMSSIAFSKTIFRSFGFLLILLFVRSPQDGWIVLMANTISRLCIGFYLYRFMLNKIGSFQLGKLRFVREIWHRAKHSFFITILPVIYNNLSVITLSIIVNPMQLGFYYGASRIHRALNTLYGPVGQAFYPHLTATKNENSLRAKILTKYFFWFMISMGSLFCISVYYFAEPIVNILLGESYIAAADTLKIFGIVLPLTAVSHVLGRQWLMAHEHDEQYLIILMISSILGFLSIFFMLGKFGIMAIPLSLIFFELISIIMILIFLSRKK